MREGDRSQPGYYTAHVFDPDGYSFEVVHKKLKMEQHSVGRAKHEKKASAQTQHHVLAFSWRVRAGRCVLIDSLSFAITCAITQKASLFRHYFARYLT